MPLPGPSSRLTLRSVSSLSVFPLLVRPASVLLCDSTLRAHTPPPSCHPPFVGLQQQHRYHRCLHAREFHFPHSDSSSPLATLLGEPWTTCRADPASSPITRRRLPDPHDSQSPDRATLRARSHPTTAAAGERRLERLPPDLDFTSSSPCPPPWPHPRRHFRPPSSDRSHRDTLHRSRPQAFLLVPRSRLPRPKSVRIRKEQGAMAHQKM